MIRRIFKRLGIGLGLLVAALLVLWAAGALWYDLPASISVRKSAAVLLVVVSGCLGLFGKRKGRFVLIGIIGVIMGWWFTLTPSNDRLWLPDVARTASAEIQGDEVTLHNVRNFDYRTATDFTPRWETRKVRISQITGVDIAINYWGSPYMAHPIISFQFADSPPVCFSIETRKEVGESYSAIGGIYRQFELIYVVADERDVIRVRTNYRKGEDIYLYRLRLSPTAARERFMDYLTSLNQLHAKPRWYNAVTTNCTTSIRTQHDSNKRGAWDWRMLVNGKGDEMLFEKGMFEPTGLGFAEFKKHSRINDAARAADAAPEFTTRIRADAPSFQ